MITQSRDIEEGEEENMLSYRNEEEHRRLEEERLRQENNELVIKQAE